MTGNQLYRSELISGLVQKDASAAIARLDKNSLSVSSLTFQKTSLVGTLLQDKWSPRLLLLLQKQQRFSDVKRALGISSKTLSARLKLFEEKELLRRTIYAQMPVHVEYELTERGREFAELLLAIILWEKNLSLG